MDLDEEKAEKPEHLNSESGNSVSDDERPTRPDIELDPSELAVNWTVRRKLVSFAAIWMFTLLSPMASSMCAPSIGLVLQDFQNSSRIYGAWVLSVYVLGYAFGPLIIAPLSELYGRLPVYHVFNTLFLIFMIACAVSDSIGMLAGFRFLAGLAGSCPITLGAGSIGDMAKPDRRGVMIALWTIGPLAGKFCFPVVGPAIGPVIGGFLTEAKGWRWVYWLLAICWGTTLFGAYIFMEETYAPILLRKKKARLLGTKRNPLIPESELSVRRLFWLTISRPIKMLFLCLDVFSLSLYQTFVYGVYYIFVTTMTRTFENVYHFGTGIVGLSFIGFGVGACSGSLICGYMSDRIMVRLTQKNGERRPEFRLPPIIPGSIFTPIGLLWFGWSVQARAHWIVPILGTVPIGIGVAACFMPSTYMIEAYPKHVASAIAATTLLRSIGGAVLPLAGPSLFDNLGQGRGNTLLAGISLIICPMTVALYKYSGVLREKSSFGREG